MLDHPNGRGAFADDRTELGPALPTIRTETLVISGDGDPVSHRRWRTGWPR